MKRFLLGVLILFLITPALNISAQESGALYIRGAWARATALPETEMSTEEAPMRHQAAGGVSALYMTIENTSDAPVTLVGASTEAAETVEIHESIMADNMMRMRPVEGGIEIPVGGSAVLEPGGYHIMLMDLNHDLVLGTAISVTLQFNLLDADGAPTGETMSIVIGAPVLEEAPAASSVIALGAWARPTAIQPMSEMDEATEEAVGDMAHGASSGVSAAYMTLVNESDQPVRLVGAQSDAAHLTEIHESRMVDNMMQMRPVEGLDIPAGDEVVLQPGGYHIMFMELTREFVPGEAIIVTLSFDTGDTVNIAVPIYDASIE